MSDVWFTSDHHFYHSNILTFKDDYGNLIRPGFEDVYHMNEYMIEQWNKAVKVNDKVYHLGDILMGTSIRSFEILNRLNGQKVLIKGNHDNAKIHRYVDYFKDIRSEIHKKTPKGEKIIFTHRPILLNDSMSKNVIINVHGHLHQRIVEKGNYFNVCVERWNYRPLHWLEILEEIKKFHFFQGEKIERKV